tara:strand:+ start:348 stop:578 length:231 start_codon:yes stop_codon:yes gene_type:complete
MYAIKDMLQSKSLWFSGGVTALGVVGWISDHSGIILALAPQLGPLLTCIGAVGIVLRVLTENSTAWKAPVEERAIN